MDVQSPTGTRITRHYRREFKPKPADPRRPTYPLPGLPHELIVTGKRRNPNVLVVRCLCMAEYGGPKGTGVKRTYYNYDPLAEVRTLDEVKAVYTAHIRECEQQV